MKTETRCLEAVTLEALEDSQTTVAQLQAQVAQKLGWQPVGSLLRLEGFKDPWERAIVRGREVDGGATLAEAAAAVGGTAASGNGGAEGGVLTITCVRRALLAEGWKIVQAGDETMSVSSDDDE